MGNPHRHQPRQGTKIVVKQACTIEQLLSKHMQGKSITAIKQLLSKGVITLNGKPIKKLGVMLEPGMTVQMLPKAEPQFKMPQGVRIVFEDKDIIVVNKDSGLLTMATEKQQSKTAYAYISNYLKFYNPNDKVFIVHRIDRDTSGLLLFAKSPMVQEELQHDWNETVKQRKYVAVCEGYPEQNEGVIRTYIREHPKSLKMSVCESTDDGAQEAITHYKVINKKHGYALVELELETGRKNQIRVHMAHIGHPLAGDVKYGAQSNPADRLCLHAQQIKFTHPTTGRTIELSSPLPQEMKIIFER